MTNRIEIYFNETLLPGSVHSSLTPAILTNDTFRVVMLSSNVVVPITRTFYVPGTFPNPGPSPKVQITLSSNNWFYRSNYYIIVNNVRDARGNVIAPNSIVPVSWGVGTNIFTPGNQPWRYHANWLNELTDGPSDVYTNAWWQTNYNESAWWADTGYGVLYAGQPTGIGDCFSSGGAPLVTFGTQDQPTLMRTWFMWPTNGLTNATLKVEYAVDDIAAFYLNGTFLFADSGFPTGPITSNTRAPNAGQAGCKTNLIANVALKPGRNLLAVAIAQNRPPAPCGTCAFDSVFGLQLDAIGFTTGPLPPKSSVNRFTLTRQDASTTIVTWPTNAYGYALVYATNFIRMGNSNVSQGPWIQEPTMKNTLANPFTITNSPINPPGARRFYQLVPTQ